MLNEHQRQKLLEKILNSTEFSNSSVYGNYLTYLVDATVNGEPVKETTIATDVFGKDANFNPAEDTIVRSHTYGLRKKLERYYFTEGKDEKIRIKIPKGHYEVSFYQVSESIYSPKYLFNLLKKYYPLILICLLTVIIALFWMNNNTLRAKLKQYQFIDKNDFIWKEYLQSDLPVLIIPGNHFVFDIYSKEFQRTFGVRDMTINSNEDLDKLKQQFPNVNIAPSPEPYFPYHSIWSLPPILNVLFSANIKPILRKSSSISPQILDEYNIIFVGSIKTLYALKYTLSKSHFDFKISPHVVMYTPPDSSGVQKFTTKLHSSGPNEDLVLALKLPGPANNSIMIIASYHSLGSPEIANYLVNEDTRLKLKEMFEEKYHHTPKYFEILFKVIGIDKTAYSTEALIYNEIKEKPITP